MTYRKTTTPEQKAKVEARRAQFKQLVKQVAQMPDAERQEIVSRVGAVVTCEGRALSMTNTMLCLLQHPSVSMVGGFRQWLKQGRSVMKGQHGMAIWIPTNSKSEGEEESETHFLMGTVFDVSQTQAVEMDVAA